jgi:hypothetical protein
MLRQQTGDVLFACVRFVVHVTIGVAVHRAMRLRSIVTTCVFLCTSFAQGQPGGVPLSPSAVKIRAAIRSLPPGQEVTILMKGRPSYHGDLQEAGDSSFSLYEVDEKRALTIGYDDVKKVRRGYGGYNSVSGRHVDPLHSRIAVIAVLGTLVAIVVAVALAKS